MMASQSVGPTKTDTPVPNERRPPQKNLRPRGVGFTVAVMGARAFSVLELTAVAAVLGIIGSLALPAISNTVIRQRQINDLNKIPEMLTDARNEARIRRACVNVASPDLVSGQGKKLRVAVDLACDGSYVESGDQVRTGVTIGLVQFPDAVGAEGITFDSRGSLKTGSPTKIKGITPISSIVTRTFFVLPATGVVRRER